MAVVEVITRVLHIVATCISLGGLFYSRVVLWPNLVHVPEASRQHYLDRMIRRFGYIKWTGIVLVAVTGVIQWLYTYPLVSEKDEPDYLLAFTLKMAGAVGLFTITALLALPSERLKGMQRHRAFWSGMNLVCGLILLVGAALMRQVRMG